MVKHLPIRPFLQKLNNSSDRCHRRTGVFYLNVQLFGVQDRLKVSFNNCLKLKRIVHLFPIIAFMGALDVNFLRASIQWIMQSKLLEFVISYTITII